jgi:hypothetical protein
MKQIDDSFTDELLDSKEGNDAADLAAVHFAVQNGWKLEDAVRDFVGDPILKALILIDSISKQ